MRCLLFRPFLIAISVACWVTVSVPTSAYCATGSNPDSLSKVYNDKGIDYAIEGNYAMAGNFFLKSVKLYSTTKNPDGGILGARYFNLGNIKRLLGYTDSALVYYSEAARYLKTLKSSQSDLAMVYVEMGNCYFTKHDYHEAISYIKQGIAILSDQPFPDHYRLVLANFKLSNTLTKLDQYAEAKAVSKKNIDLARKYGPQMLSAIYSGLGNMSLAENDYAVALRYYMLAEQCINRGEFLSTEDASSVYNNIGFLYRQQKAWLRAETYLEKSLVSYKHFAGSGPNNIAQVIFNIGELNSVQGRFRKAINRYNEALSVLRKPITSKSRNLTRQPRYFSYLLAATIYQKMGDAYLDLFRETDSTQNVLAALRCYGQAVTLVEEIRLGLFGEEDKLSVSARFNEVFNKAVGAALLLAKTNSEYVDVAFQFASKGKAAVLSESLRRVSGLSVAGVPAKLQAKEQQMRRRIGLLSEMVYEEQKKKNPSGKYLKDIDADLFGEQDRYRQLQKSIEVDYPKYYALKYDTTSVSIPAIQAKLKPDQIYVEYVIQDSILYSFAISPQTVRWNAQPLHRDFFRNLDVFQKELVPIDFGSLNATNLNRFAASSYSLYTILLQPFKALTAGKTLVVVPHNELSSIPFSALITKKPIRPKGYYSLPYLIKTNPVLVTLSSKEFLSNGNLGPSLFASSLSVAPSYSGVVGGTLSNRAAYRENLSELYGAEEEVKWVSKVFGGDVIVGKAASETYFKRVAEGYDVLHLAMHTFVDERNPLFSKLIFYNCIDTVDDSYLNAYEVYGMKLKARLAILSACRSGDGTLVKGEGLMSLSRAFQYAGCPSMVVTQWRVDDFSGGAVMKSFAGGLKAGFTKSYALRRAQLEFLKTSDPLRSHPYFWAGYQVVGSDEPVFKPLWQMILPFMVVVLIVLQLVGIWFRKLQLH